jgi:GTP1/Obg family GTP-binding protein
MSNEDTIDRRDYGRMEAQVEQLTKDVHVLKETVEVMRDMMQQAQGGWKTIMIIGGVASTVGGAVSWVLGHVKFS